jgi:hypothetical protein
MRVAADAAGVVEGLHAQLRDVAWQARPVRAPSAAAPRAQHGITEACSAPPPPSSY